MAISVIQSNKGFSLIEAMIATLLLTIMMVLSLQGLMTVNRAVAGNKIRQEAIKLGQELLVDARAEPFLALSATSPAIPATDPVNFPNDIKRQIASYDITFTVTPAVVTTITNISKSVQYTISWTSRSGNTHSYIAQSIVSNYR